jgi:hypothetical protein
MKRAKNTSSGMSSEAKIALAISLVPIILLAVMVISPVIWITNTINIFRYVVENVENRMK